MSFCSAFSVSSTLSCSSFNSDLLGLSLPAPAAIDTMAHSTLRVDQQHRALGRNSGTASTKQCLPHALPAPFRPAQPQGQAHAPPINSAAPALQRQRCQPLCAVRADQAADTLDTATVQLIADITKRVDTQLANTVKAASETARDLDLSTSSELRVKVVNAIAKLQKGLLERETEVSGVHHAEIACGMLLTDAPACLMLFLQARWGCRLALFAVPQQIQPGPLLTGHSQHVSLCLCIRSA